MKTVPRHLLERERGSSSGTRKSTTIVNNFLLKEKSKVVAKWLFRTVPEGAEKIPGGETLARLSGVSKVVRKVPRREVF